MKLTDYQKQLIEKWLIPALGIGIATLVWYLVIMDNINKGSFSNVTIGLN